MSIIKHFVANSIKFELKDKEKADMVFYGWRYLKYFKNEGNMRNSD